MEMHCIRYFVAVAQVMNFTRAAERCRVKQPTLTRAIKKLEDELGGDLFHRERSQTHLTELGRSVLPYLEQCYKSAKAAEELAAKYRRGKFSTLRIAVSYTVAMDLLAPHLKEAMTSVAEMELDYCRGTAEEITELLKNGDVELAIAGPLGESWDRLDAWSLFQEECVLAVNDNHPYAHKNTISISALTEFPLLVRPYSECYNDMLGLLNKLDIDPQNARSVRQDEDLISLIKLGMGACFIPISVARANGLKYLSVEDKTLSRSIYLYSVAGRKRTLAGTTFIGLLCSSDWNTQDMTALPNSENQRKSRSLLTKLVSM